ncbi:MAG: prepilin-type N-terminal cleavage/methylation domain-containing protein [Lautropia sp.]|nr:prepilin-type N-terminal cleavage/methylation domain-containing protein [Lautropia sp.]
MTSTRPAQPAHSPRTAHSGFTLVEMMIVCGVIALLAAIAYPSYSAQILKSQQMEGKAALMRAAQLLERSFTQNGAYPSGADSLVTLYGAAAGTPLFSNADNPLSATMGKFQIDYVPAAGAAPVEYVLRATPQTTAISDSDCPTFGIDSRGRRLVSDAVPAASSRCWR